MKKVAYNLQEISFPDCAKLCLTIEVFGASECDSICPGKFIKPTTTTAWLVCEVNRLNEILNIGTNPKGGKSNAREKISS
jgi:hypothetical protein